MHAKITDRLKRASRTQHAAIGLTAFFLNVTVPLTALATDSDSDGIPADWEEFRGTSDSNAADALLDFDGDGLNTYQEYLTQGRPWGNYDMVRFPWALPADVDSGSRHHCQ
jgi:hypothetical protein